MRGCPNEYMKSQCERGLWHAFHDAELCAIREDHARQTVKLEFLADFPNPPRKSAKLIGLEFADVREFRLFRWEPPAEERPSDWDEAEDWSKRGSLLPFSMVELREALVDDWPVYVSAAGANGVPPTKFMAYLPFVNLPLGVLIEIDAEAIHVTADGRASSFEEWMAWGSAGWETFSRQGKWIHVRNYLKAVINFGRLP